MELAPSPNTSNWFDFQNVLHLFENPPDLSEVSELLTPSVRSVGRVERK